MAIFPDENRVLDADPFKNIQQRIQFTIIRSDGSESFLDFGYDSFNDCGVRWTCTDDLQLFYDNISIRDALALLNMDDGQYALTWCDKPDQTINDILSTSFSGCPLCQITIDKRPSTA